MSPYANAHQDEPAPSALKVFAVVAFYMVAALVMVFVNKAVLNSSPDLPLSFLLIQLVIAVVMLHLANFFTAFVPSIDEKFALPLLSFSSSSAGYIRLPSSPKVNANVGSPPLPSPAWRRRDSDLNSPASSSHQYRDKDDERRDPFSSSSPTTPNDETGTTASVSWGSLAETAMSLAPLVGIGLLSLVFNTLCLRGVDASFFQIARGMLIPFTLIVQSVSFGGHGGRSRSNGGAQSDADGETTAGASLSYFAASMLPSFHFPRDSGVWRAAAIVTLGFFMGVASPEVGASSTSSPASAAEALKWGAYLEWKTYAHEDVVAVSYGVLSALLTAVHAVMVKRAQNAPGIGGSVVKLAWWTNALSALMLLPCVLLNGEAQILFQRFFVPHRRSLALSEADHTFLTGSLVTGITGFFLCIAGLLSIRVTSPLTHMFAGALRSVAQTVLGRLVFRDHIGIRRALSISVITLGAAYYTWVQSKGRNGLRGRGNGTNNSNGDMLTMRPPLLPTHSRTSSKDEKAARQGRPSLPRRGGSSSPPPSFSSADGAPLSPIDEKVNEHV